MNTFAPLSLEQLNSASCEAFTALLDSAYAHAPWIAMQTWAKRPFRSLAALKHALALTVRQSDREAQQALLAAQPDILASVDIGAGLSAGQAHLQAHWHALSARYRETFGFPFVLATAGPRGTGLSLAQIVATLERRLLHPADVELAEALRSLHRIAELRLDHLTGTAPIEGQRVWDWAERLAVHSEPGFAERGELTVTYLSDAHRAVAQRLAHWMKADCGFDDVTIDAVGNVVGVYHGTDAAAPRLMTGSHYDTVRNGGKYDGRLGILVPMACVRALSAAGRRLPFGLEVVGFAEEEGQRYKAVFLGSGALTGQFDAAWLDQRDADGIPLREAMAHAGLCIADIPRLRRDPARYLGFVEVHIEQGPVLNELDLPLGVVTSINGSVRYVGEVIGMASHAGTTPMGRRRDAAAAVAELILLAERLASAEPDLVATVGLLEVPHGSINVVPGRCRFSLDVRATTNAVRDACATDLLDGLRSLCARRGLRYTLEETLRASAAPSAPDWQARWERAVAGLGLPVHRMPSGAGHDAMKLHELMPQAMLFARGENAGISHNPLESTTAHDMDLCVGAFQSLLTQLSEAKP